MQADKLTNSSQFPLLNFGAYLGVDMKEIPLTQNQVTLVDDSDFERLNRFKWHADKPKTGDTFYAKRKLPTINDKRSAILMHHEIIGKPPKGFEVDHRNGNGLDNQRKNLRFVTHRQNGQNQKNRKKKSSKYPGVHWEQRSKKWKTKIVINGKEKYLGIFTDELKAFYVYKQAVESIGEKIIGELKCL